MREFNIAENAYEVDTLLQKTRSWQHIFDSRGQNFVFRKTLCASIYLGKWCRVYRGNHSGAKAQKFEQDQAHAHDEQILRKDQKDELEQLRLNPSTSNAGKGNR